MADIELVIKIPEEVYNYIMRLNMCNMAEEYIKNGTVISRNLCDSCKTKGCIFQYGIVRSHCDFYKAESEDKE